MALSNADIAEFFQTAETSIPGNRSLREPQVDGHAAAVDYFAGSGDRAVEQIPVGCGKTGLHRDPAVRDRERARARDRAEPDDPRPDRRRRRCHQPARLLSPGRRSR